MENSAHNWYRQHVNSLLFIDEPSISPLGAAVQLLFSLPPVWAFPSSHLGIPISAFFNWISFVFVPLFVFLFSDWMRLPSSSLGFPFLSFGAFPSSHLGPSIYQFPSPSSSLSFESLACWMLEQFVFEKVHFLGSLQQGTAAVEVRLPIFSSPDPCKETFDEKGQKDWNHFRDLVHFNKQGRNTLCSRPFSPDKVSSDEMLHSTLYTVSSSLPAWKTLRRISLTCNHVSSEVNEIGTIFECFKAIQVPQDLRTYQCTSLEARNSTEQMTSCGCFCNSVMNSPGSNCRK